MTSMALRDVASRAWRSCQINSRLVKDRLIAPRDTR
jgi:hypothetical protein